MIAKRAMQCLIVVLLLAVTALDAEATRVAVLPVKQLFSQTGLVFIGTAKYAPEICKRVDGPCTGVAFTNIEVVAGESDTSHGIAFLLPEGDLPDGTSLKIAGAPTFLSGERYLVFVRAGAWHLTPVTNWFHSVFRECPVGLKDRQLILFVNEDGRPVTAFDERGFQLGERIAPPARQIATALQARGGARSGIKSSQPPIVEKKVKAALASGPNEIAPFGLPKEKLIQAIARYASKLGLNRTDKIQFQASKSGVHDDQRQPGPNAAGLSKEVVERQLSRREVFPKKGHDQASETVREVEKPRAISPSPGKETNPSRL